MLNVRVNGAKLRTRREKAGMSVAAIAEKAGCSAWNIYNIEKGRSQPSAKTYGLLRKALKIADDSLLEKTGSTA